MEEVWIFFLSLLSPNRGRPLVSGVSLPHAGFLLTLLQSPESVSTFTQVSGSHEICGFALLARLTGPDSDVDQDCQTLLLLLLLYNLYILYNKIFKIQKPGRIQHPSGPILARMPYVWHPRCKLWRKKRHCELKSTNLTVDLILNLLIWTVSFGLFGLGISIVAHLEWLPFHDKKYSDPDLGIPVLHFLEPRFTMFDSEPVKSTLDLSRDSGVLGTWTLAYRVNLMCVDVAPVFMSLLWSSSPVSSP